MIELYNQRALYQEHLSTCLFMQLTNQPMTIRLFLKLLISKRSLDITFNVARIKDHPVSLSSADKRRLVHKRGQRGVTRLLTADRKAAVTQTTTVSDF